MFRNPKKELQNPRQNANVFSISTFWWLRKLLWTGYRRELEETDVHSTLAEDKSDHLGELIVSSWENELKRCNEKKHGAKPKLYRILFDCFGKSLLKVGLLYIPSEFGLKIVQPFLLAKMLRYFSVDKKQWTNEVYYFGATFCLLPIIQCILTNWCSYRLTHIGMKIRVACGTLIYRKILRLSSSVLENETSAGQVINFFTNDATTLDHSVLDIHYLWSAPLQTILITYLIFREIGWTAVGGVIAFLISVPLQLYFGYMLTCLTVESLKKTDYRLRLTNQLLSGLEILKMYVWDAPYSRLVEKAREEEVKFLKKFLLFQTFNFSFNTYVPRLCVFLTLVTYVMTGNHINAAKVFMLTAFYNILRNTMQMYFPKGLYEVARMLASMARLEQLLMLPEISKSKIHINQISTTSMPVYMKSVTVKRDNSGEYAIQDLNLSVRSGEFVAIVGETGSGKSSLLQTILSEFPLESGTLETSGKISFANQHAWLFASSVKQNILFGQPMNETRYNEIIRVCQLKADVDSLPHGDETMVGERGMNLSGGQRAKINLARALYIDADIYLLDDPLSSVDDHVGSRIVEECICGFLKNKTRILVIHQLQYLRSVDMIVVMKNGGILVRGNFDELRSMNLDFMETFNNVDNNEEVMRFNAENEERETALKYDPEEAAEKKAIGRVSVEVFVSYWNASGKLLLAILVLAAIIVTNGLGSCSDYSISMWVNAETVSWIKMQNGTTVFRWSGFISRDGMIGLYSALIVVFIWCSIYMIIIYCNFCMRASKNLHDKMLHGVTRTRMYFYNTNPLGRILNRFSKDIGAIDQELPNIIYDVVSFFFIFIGGITIIGLVNPWFLIPTFFTMLLFYFIRSVCIASSRAVKRLEDTTRSPVIDHVGATIQGLTTIRALKAEKILTKQFDNHQDHHSASWLTFASISRALSLYAELFCQIYIALMIVAFMVFDGLAVVGDIGLVITQIMMLTGLVQYGMSETAELENQSTSTERVLEYSCLEEEPFLESKPGKGPPENWPSQGQVEFRNVKLKYGPEGIHVLKGISFIAKPKEKIGIVGRTGAGKSSLISALFRLAYVEGDILIDNVSTETIALQDLRSKIGIIPQQATLFGGSLRENLDPLNVYPDEVLWDALEEVDLKNTIAGMATGLNITVTEGGLNFSVGQRQLLSLARALVRSSRIVVLDEVTANVDPQTDSLIQRTIRRKFKDSTVFTIAHRLNTIMDSDKVLVIDQGHAVEFDHPYILLQNKGYFYAMVKDSGAAMNDIFSEAAEKYFTKDDTISS